MTTGREIETEKETGIGIEIGIEIEIESEIETGIEIGRENEIAGIALETNETTELHLEKTAATPATKVTHHDIEDTRVPAVCPVQRATSCQHAVKIYLLECN